MPTNKVIADKDNQIKNSSFDMTHNYDATVCFGEVLPTFFQFLHQPSKNNLLQQSSVRMFPLVSPVLGKITVKNCSNFIGISEVFPKWKNVLTNTTGLSIFTNTTEGDSRRDSWQQTATTMFPSITSQMLHFLFYDCCGFAKRIPLIKTIPTGTPPNVTEFKVSSGRESDRKKIWQLMRGIDVNDTQALDFLKSVQNSDSLTFEDPSDFHEKVFRKGLEGTFAHYFGVWKLNKDGIRCKKILDSLGYLASAAKGNDQIYLNLLPLFAFYRAYFINYLLPLQNYYDWEDTYCYKLIESFSHENGPCLIADGTIQNNPVLRKRVQLLINFFRLELSQCCYTDNTLESMCLNGSMINKKVVANPFVGLRNFDSLDGSESSIGSFTVHSQALNVGLNGAFSALDEKILQRMYTYVARNSIEGAELEKELIARGYVDWVSQNHTRFLGCHEYELEISEIDSVTDSLSADASTGSNVGEPYGKGFGSSNGKHIVFDNNEPGFLFTMTSIVPACRPKQNLNMSLLQTDILSWYNPMFDGLGYEALPVAQLPYMNEVTDASDTEVLNDSFGIVPRYSSLKSRKDILVGQFNSARSFDTIGTYILTQVMQRNPDYGKVNDAKDGYLVPYVPGVGPVIGNTVMEFTIPRSSKYWTKTLLSSYFGTFDRIFNQLSRNYQDVYVYNEGVRPKRHKEYVEGDSPLSDSAYIDTFMLHCINVYDMTTQMLPISLSYSCSSNETSSKVEL